MSSIDLNRGVPPARASSAMAAHAFAARPRLVLALGIVAAAALGQLMALSRWTAVWSSGAFFDTDDAMRAVQVRDLLAGQGWFDMTQYRLDPPHGVFMHWSRVVDAPLVALTKIFAVFADPAVAERLARLAFPFLLTIALFALLIALCETLLGRSARFPALAACFLYGPAVGQFEPGRIDHHAPQIVLLVLCLFALSHALVLHRRSTAYAAGAAVPLSFSISVENTPFFIALFGALLILWIVRGPALSRVLTAFAIGIAVTLPPIYLATIAPDRLLIAVSDALSLAQAAAMLAASALYLLLARAGLALPDRWRPRALLGAGAASLTALLLAFAFPILVHDPFAQLDPLLRSMWLDRVLEAQPLVREWRSDPFWVIGNVVPCLLALLGAAQAVMASERENTRTAWLLVLLTSLGGLGASCFMVRTLSATLALSVPGGLALALAWRARQAHRGPVFHGPFVTALLVLATSSVGWSAAANAMESAKSLLPGSAANGTGRPATERAIGEGCTNPAAFETLATLAPGLVFADPDLGSYILAHTKHAVITGSYHRNTAGMARVVTALLAPPDRAHTLVRESGANYVVYCRTGADPHYAAIAPDSFAAALASGAAPNWLRQRAAESAMLDVYQVN